MIDEFNSTLVAILRKQTTRSSLISFPWERLVIIRYQKGRGCLSSATVQRDAEKLGGYPEDANKGLVAFEFFILRQAK
jgi:hypothetical protein